MEGHLKARQSLWDFSLFQCCCKHCKQSEQQQQQPERQQPELRSSAEQQPQYEPEHC